MPGSMFASSDWLAPLSWTGSSGSPANSNPPASFSSSESLPTSNAFVDPDLVPLSSHSTSVPQGSSNSPVPLTPPPPSVDVGTAPPIELPLAESVPPTQAPTAPPPAFESPTIPLPSSPTDVTPPVSGAFAMNVPVVNGEGGGATLGAITQGATGGSSGPTQVIDLTNLNGQAQGMGGISSTIQPSASRVIVKPSIQGREFESGQVFDHFDADLNLQQVLPPSSLGAVSANLNAVDAPPTFEQLKEWYNWLEDPKNAEDPQWIIIQGQLADNIHLIEESVMRQLKNGEVRLPVTDEIRAKVTDLIKKLSDKQFIVCEKAQKELTQIAKEYEIDSIINQAIKDNLVNADVTDRLEKVINNTRLNPAFWKLGAIYWYKPLPAVADDTSWPTLREWVKNHPRISGQYLEQLQLFYPEYLEE